MKDDGLLKLVQELIQKDQDRLKREDERRIRSVVFAVVCPWLVIGLILIFLLAKDCAGPNIDPMDDSIMATREIVAHVEVLDTTRNGFRVVYITRDAVTKARLEEIRSRSEVKETFRRLQDEAPAHFGGDLMATDIYDFAAVAKQYVPGGLSIHNIFVSGVDKCRLYVQANPAIENHATWFNFNTEQGAQYLSADDISFRTTSCQRIYRYWKCSGNNTISTTDERFSHFSEDERLW